MRGLCSAFLILLLRLESHILTAEYPKLKLVQILFRHGARSPLSFYPTNIHKDYWTYGTGELTQIGMKESYNLGDYLRRRYDGFLSQNYSHYEVSVRSTDFDRTLMSAECVLAAMYPPEGTQVWNEDIQWQPVPIHTMPLKVDALLGYDPPPCPLFEKLREDAEQSTWLKEKLQPYQDTINYLRTMSGFYKDKSDLKVAEVVYDTTISEMTEGLAIASWISKDIFDILSNQIFIFNFEVKFGTQKQAILAGGVFMQEIYDNMLMVKEGVMDEQKKLYMYSAHDNNLVTFQYNIGAFNGKMPLYSTCVMVELWEMAAEVYSVRVLYRNVTDSDVTHTIVIPGCEEFCPLETFYNLIEPHMLMAEERDDACRPAGENVSKKVLAAVLTLVVFIMMILLLLFFIYRVRKRGPVSTKEEIRPLVKNSNIHV